MTQFVSGDPYVGYGTGQAPPGAGFLPSAGTVGSVIKTVAGAALGGVIRNLAGQSSSTASQGVFREGADIDILSQREAAAAGLIPNGRKRRRRRKLLTCSDKADIAFLYGQLGGGQLGRAAISSLLSRRCS